MTHAAQAPQVCSAPTPPVMPHLARLVLAVWCAAPLAGCASTTVTVDASDPVAVRRVEAAVVGRQADITLVSGAQYRGEVVFLRPDSTTWTASARAVTVPTVNVASVAVFDGARGVVRRALVGAGKVAGAGFLFGALLSKAYGGDGSDMLQSGIVIGALCAPGGLANGLLDGALNTRQTVYRLVPPEAEAGPRSPRGTPDHGDAQ